MGGTGRYVVSLASGDRDLKTLLAQVQTHAGVHRREAALSHEIAADRAGESAITVVERFHVAAVRMDPTAALALSRSGRGVRVRPERVFALPSRFAVSRSPKHAAGPHALGLVATSTANWARAAVGTSASKSTGKNVKVAILDSGLKFDHPDFRARTEIGQRARVFAPGVSSANDVLGHGTFCAGIIAGTAAPTKGPAYGVAPDVDLHVARVFDGQNEARELDVIDAVRWALESGCKVISFSGGDVPDSKPDPELSDVARECWNAGALWVVAAGNDSVRPHRAPVRSPANTPSTIAVAAMTPQLRATNDSNAGLSSEPGGEIDLGAPGQDVYSSTIDADGYGYADGTSVATPFVAGCAALDLERAPAASIAKRWLHLTSTAKAPSDRDAPGCTRADVGEGLVQAS